MRHFNFIQAIYANANVNVEPEELLAIYNMAKVSAKYIAASQFSFKGISWSVRLENNYMRVALDVNGIRYFIYDGDEYDLPSLDVTLLKN